MAGPSNLKIQIRIDYLDDNLCETTIKYASGGNKDFIKGILQIMSISLDKLTETNKDIFDDL